MTDVMQVTPNTTPHTSRTRVALLLRGVKRIIPVNFWDEAKRVSLVAGPVFLAQLMEFSISTVSTIFCGHLGRLELEIVSLATTVINVSAISVGAGLASTCDTLFSQTHGSKNLKRLGVILQRGILILMIFCFPCCALLLNTEHILSAFKQSPEVARLTTSYVKIFIPALPAIFLYQLEIKYLQNQGINMPQVFTGFLANIFNAAVNYILVYMLPLGIQGSAAASVVSWYCQAIFLFFYIRWRKLYVETWAGWSTECLQEWGHFVRLAIPSMLMLCIEWWSYEIGMFLSGLINVVELGAQSVVYQILTMVCMCVSAGVLRGAGKQKLGAVANFVGFYLIGFPIGISLMFAGKLGILGFWLGLMSCTAIQFVFFQVVIYKLNWNEASDQALVNAGVKKDVNSSHRASGSQTEDILTGVCSGNIAVIDVSPVEDTMGQPREETSAPKTSASPVQETLTVKQLIVRRGLAFLSAPLILAIGLLLLKV
ncbi:multidrug and toxin extrusion protein 1-like isoform X2 [Pristis pectinata]|uniref:multidrug and toxin extrusion protein 1-like isoform X2 n=1 Tax=Pristis pectinata TaxID=685728 RepID=UPI00223CFC91|nr:multidrug and toxin extrusion protein 1-like isoform X2 [Pristis pectinata]